MFLTYQHFPFRVKYSHNKVVTDKMVKDVVGAGDHEEKSDIACECLILRKKEVIFIS